MTDESRAQRNSGQRDRLAAVLPELAGGLFEVDWYADGERMKPVLPYADDLADALLARGVRVVDVDTLAAALFAVRGDLMLAEGPEYAALAAAILAALDAEP